MTVDLTSTVELLPVIAELESELMELTDAELTERAVALRARETRSDRDTLVQTCALGREAARRAIDQRPFNVQLLGAESLLAGRVVEMATGEGKTLTAAIAASGFAAQGPVHVLTVNDYLARRDAEWMGPIYELLGLSVGWVNESSTRDERKAAYAKDITYVSANEAGFDFLRDGLVPNSADRVQRELATVIVDEADSILIDEARVPLVLAGSTVDVPDLPNRIAEVVRGLELRKHYQVLEDGRSVHLTPVGLAEVERVLGDVDLYSTEHFDLLTAVNVALHAEALLKRDVDYIVRGGKVELVDEFRGRVAQRRRWPDGLQAAVEAKEQLTGTGSGQVLSTMTMQAYIKQYNLICGMTGTALPVGEQLREFYELEVAVIPPNKPNVRVDQPDQVFPNQRQKDQAVVAEITAAHAEGRPVLVGTLNVAASERLAARLAKAGVAAQVLNAKNDAKEAAIVAEAGGFGAVTVSTQMTGRGVDIRLGGSDERDRERVAALGGLLVIGTSRHESQRVDFQLRGRAGRQGDPGESIFFVSLDDDLMTRFAPAQMPKIRPDAIGPLHAPEVRRAVIDAQRIAEEVNLEVHRTTWKYHFVLEQQRQSLAQRREEVLTTDAAAVLMKDVASDKYADLVEEHGEEPVLRAAREILLYHIDACWAEHLADMADLREGIHLRVLGLQNPIDEFHREAIPAFRELMPRIEAAAAETFEGLKWTDGEWDSSESGLIRPGATWTYVVNDDPFGGEMERFFTGIVDAFRGRRNR